MNLSDKAHNKLENRINEKAFRVLGKPTANIDFSSNDYLGLASDHELFDEAHLYLNEKYKYNGATGSRLLTGNHALYAILEDLLIATHESEAALVFNSGYNANIGVLSSLVLRNDIVLYDELSHASIRDGLKLSNGKSYAYKHNDLQDLKVKLGKFSQEEGDQTIYVVTESVFSMDGDQPDLNELVLLCKQFDAKLIIDEAHALGVFDKGLVQKLDLVNDVFIRVITFGKAIGTHGAAVLCAESVKQYLVNFCRSLIYTTALPPHTIATTIVVYQKLFDGKHQSHSILHQRIQFFRNQLQELGLKDYFIESNSAIQCCIISGNIRTKECAKILQENGFDVKPILSPTVSQGKERLRFCIHSFNTEQEITRVLKLLSKFVAQ